MAATNFGLGEEEILKLLIVRYEEEISDNVRRRGRRKRRKRRRIKGEKRRIRKIRDEEKGGKRRKMGKRSRLREGGDG